MQTKRTEIDNYFRNFGSKGKIYLPSDKSGTIMSAIGMGGNHPLIAIMVKCAADENTNEKGGYKR